MEILTVKITLLDTEPPIWRRVTIPAGWTLGHLHDAIQAVFGWENCHLHEFEVAGRRFGIREHWEEEGHLLEEESEVKLGALNLVEEQTFRYSYDFGDGWEHEVLVEKIEPATAGEAPAPRCIAGQMHAPLEDCGGPWGWANLVEAVNDRSHPEHRELLRWAGGRIDPAEFDLEAANAGLKPRRKRSPHRRRGTA